MIIKVSHSYYSKFRVYRKSTEKKIKISCSPQTGTSVSLAQSMQYHLPLGKLVASGVSKRLKTGKLGPVRLSLHFPPKTMIGI